MLFVVRGVVVNRLGPVGADDPLLDRTALHLGGQHDVVAPPGDGLADDLLRLSGRADVGGVDEVDAGVEGPVWMMRVLSSWSLVPHSPNIMAPRHRGETCTPVRPSGRSCMFISFLVVVLALSWFLAGRFGQGWMSTLSAVRPAIAR